MQDLNKTIAENLLTLRKQKGLSLSGLSEATGVSKSMLGQIERAESNPTVTTLWKIAKGLNISFSSLVEHEKKPFKVVRQKNIIPIIGDEQEYKVYTIFPFDEQRKIEVFDVHFSPGCILKSESHINEVFEYVLVYKGSLEITIEDKSIKLLTNDAIKFYADKSHIYKNISKGTTKMHNIIFYG